MNPSPAAVAAIQTYAAALSGGWAGNADDAILAAANAPSVANPTPQPTVAKPYTYVDLLGHLSAGSIAKLVVLPSLPTIVDSINAGNLLACQRWIATLVAGAIITGDEATALGGVMAATEPDPAFPARISWAEADIGRPLDLSDISEARPQ